MNTPEAISQLQNELRTAQAIVDSRTALIAALQSGSFAEDVQAIKEAQAAEDVATAKVADLTDELTSLKASVEPDPKSEPDPIEIVPDPLTGAEVAENP